MDDQNILDSEGNPILHDVTNAPEMAEGQDITAEASEASEKIGKSEKLWNLIKSKVTHKKGEMMYNKLESALANPQNMESIITTFNKADTTIPMRYFRGFWNQLPKEGQWLVMKLTTPPPLWAFYKHGPLGAALSAGFLEYKGHLDEDGRVNEEAIKVMGGVKKFMLTKGMKMAKWATKWGGKIDPELKPVHAALEYLTPYYQQIEKTAYLTDDKLAQIRQEVLRNRAEFEAKRNNPAGIQESTRENLACVLYPEDVRSAAYASNDNQNYAAAA